MTGPYSAKCGLMWQEDPNSNYCYQFYDQQNIWQDARTICKGQGGDLASIASREEQFYIAGKQHFHKTNINVNKFNLARS